ncbi:hypothetical protein BDU57DRAFT_540155 [Ampelomyces quisqualis]|uniref:Uncharacterized protein n=1 Tax=Ampelomyces quisqualis TaxID=50730 RepID=A0A6A5QHK2_AMPQU|nr:hypothetical protein BDU57DRAFT_540155 [Ampelomyces quisqualis]
MISLPLPYDPRWTSKLLRRDICDLGTKFASKIKARFSPSPPKTATISVREHVDVVSVEALNPLDIEISQLAARSEHTSTLYDLLEGRLKAVWASRDRDVSHKERWQFRGSWLVLWTALQACPSNASYDIFESPKADETALLLELLKLTTATTPNIAHRVSKMPAAPFQGSRTHVRYDSAFSNGSSGAYEVPKPTHSELWHGILMGASDASQLISVAEWLLSCVWPGENPHQILDAIGDPSKHFLGNDELRVQLRDLLSPSHSSIASPMQFQTNLHLSIGCH